MLLHNLGHSAAGKTLNAIRGVYATPLGEPNDLNRTVAIDAKSGDTILVFTFHPNNINIKPTTVPVGNLFTTLGSFTGSVGYYKYVALYKTLTADTTSLSMDGHAIVIVLKGTHTIGSNLLTDTIASSTLNLPVSSVGRKNIFVSFSSTWNTGIRVTTAGWETLMDIKVVAGLSKVVSTIDSLPNRTVMVDGSLSNFSVSANFILYD